MFGADIDPLRLKTRKDTCLKSQRALRVTTRK